MSAADFLLAPEVQKFLKVVFAEPTTLFSPGALAKRTRLDEADCQRTQEHLLKCGILRLHAAKDGGPEAVSANTSFVFYNELRHIALKSFAAAEPLRAMLRSKFKDSVMRAVVLGEDVDATVELLVVHGQLVPEESAMAAACQKLSATLGRHLRVHVMSSRKYAAYAMRHQLDRRLAEGTAIEIIAEGDTKARPDADRGGLLQSAREKLAALAR